MVPVPVPVPDMVDGDCFHEMSKIHGRAVAYSLSQSALPYTWLYLFGVKAAAKLRGKALGFFHHFRARINRYDSGRVNGCIGVRMFMETTRLRDEGSAMASREVMILFWHWHWHWHFLKASRIVRG
jgi:hypothetical protein